MLWALPLRLQAQAPRMLSDEARISLLTILPGDAVYSAFGHSAFRVYDPTQGIDWTFNYGTFDFQDPLFVPKFIYGKLDYFLSVGDHRAALRFYRDVEERPVIEQVLDLDATQRAAVYTFLETNAQPENRGYRYDFLFDNCSTRLRDVLEQALPGALRFASTPVPQTSFRHLLDPYVADRPFLDLGFYLVLGTPTDRIPSAREVVFLPDDLLQAFDAATVEDNGTTRSLVARKDTLFWIEGTAKPQRAFSWPFLLFTVGLAVGASGIVRGMNRDKHGRPWGDVVLFGAVGLAGLLLLFMWFGTEHVVTRYNWNLLWAWPTHLVAAYALARTRPAPWLRPYLIVTGVGTLLVLLGWFWWPQDLHPALLPLLLLLLLRSAWQTRQLTRPTP